MKRAPIDPWCVHSEKVPVESGGETVAWLCLSCDKQLPAIPEGARYVYTGPQIGELGVPPGTIVTVREVVPPLTNGVGDGTVDAVVVEMIGASRAWSMPLDDFQRDYVLDPH